MPNTCHIAEKKNNHSNTILAKRSQDPLLDDNLDDYPNLDEHLTQIEKTFSDDDKTFKFDADLDCISDELDNHISQIEHIFLNASDVSNQNHTDRQPSNTSIPIQQNIVSQVVKLATPSKQSTAQDFLPHNGPLFHFSNCTVTINYK